jgi:hypothetical protein
MEEEQAAAIQVVVPRVKLGAQGLEVSDPIHCSPHLCMRVQLIIQESL